MIGYTLAKRYARALIDLAQEEKKLDEVATGIERLAALFEVSPGKTDPGRTGPGKSGSPGGSLAEFFANPTVPIAAKAEALDEILKKSGISGLTAEFARFLLGKKRILGLPEIARAFRDLWDGLQNRVHARLVSAFPLGAEETERARKALSSLSGKEIVLAVEVDPGIIGGLVAYVGSYVYDGSVRNQLVRFSKSMHKGR